ncbi:MAG: hypothetical protein LBD82_06485 [Deltaproteobacteria bacterium]|jgi:hypothetical protein|nr:hypothetical protein [Deltaproteobacteria bacterium]
MPGFTAETTAHPFWDALQTGADGRVEDAVLLARWRPYLRRMLLRVGGDSFLALWLDEHVEAEVDAGWKRWPSEGLWRHSLAMNLCMNAVRALVPDAASLGCCPLPPASAPLRRALARAGLADANTRGERPLILSRRYSTLTFYPFRGACPCCALRNDCPKAL